MPAEKTKTEKTLALDAMSLTSHGCSSRLKIPRASSGIFSRLLHPPIGFCIQHKAINKIKPFLRDKDESLKSSVQFVGAILRTRIHSWTRIERIWRIYLRLIIHQSCYIRSRSSHPYNPYNPFNPWSFYLVVLFSPCILLPSKRDANRHNVQARAEDKFTWIMPSAAVIQHS